MTMHPIVASSSFSTMKLSGASEVALLLAHARSLNDRAALSIAYGCGLRVSEIANLKVADIDSARMLIRVEHGKGRKDRYVMLASCGSGGG